MSACSSPTFLSRAPRTCLLQAQAATHGQLEQHQHVDSDIDTDTEDIIDDSHHHHSHSHSHSHYHIDSDCDNENIQPTHGHVHGHKHINTVLHKTNVSRGSSPPVPSSFLDVSIGPITITTSPRSSTASLSTSTSASILPSMASYIRKYSDSDSEQSSKHIPKQDIRLIMVKPGTSSNSSIHPSSNHSNWAVSVHAKAAFLHHTTALSGSGSGSVSPNRSRFPFRGGVRHSHCCSTRSSPFSFSFSSSSSCTILTANSLVSWAVRVSILLMLLLVWQAPIMLHSINNDSNLDLSMSASTSTSTSSSSSSPLSPISALSDVHVHVDGASGSELSSYESLYASSESHRRVLSAIKKEMEATAKGQHNANQQQQQQQDQAQVMSALLERQRQRQRQQQLMRERMLTRANAQSYNSWYSGGNGQAAAESFPPESSPEDDMAGPPIDVVYTWVNGSDPSWQATVGRYGDVSSIANKYREWDELRYSMRSVAMYAPWVRHLILVTSRQVPIWLNVSDPRIRIVFHHQLFPDPANELPTFNSLAIESVLHRIPGLSEDFIYMNNDVFLGRPISRSMFSTGSNYYRYLDYGMQMRSSCLDALSRDSQDVSTLTASISQCGGEEFYWNQMLSQHYYQQRITHWFTHMPHQWNRVVIHQMQQHMNKWFQQARKNRFRNHQTDISTHIQYESFLEHIAQQRQQQQQQQQDGSSSSSSGWLMPQLRRVVPVIVSDMSDYDHHHLYQYYVFMNHDNHQSYYDRLRERMDYYQPAFIAIDDDLKDPDPMLVAWHKMQFTAFCKQYWPTSASWEQDEAKTTTHNRDGDRDGDREAPADSVSNSGVGVRNPYFDNPYAAAASRSRTRTKTRIINQSLS